MIVSKRISFDAAHFLPEYEGPCVFMHGHHFSVELAVQGEVNHETGMVMDFKYLKEFLQSIKDIFDHTLLNNIISNPTAENIALYIKEQFDTRGRYTLGDVKLAFIKVWETEDSCVEIRV